MPVADEDTYKTTFISHAGICRLHQMPTGLMNASATFQRAHDIIVNKYTCKPCLVYLDDINTFFKDHDQHLQDIANLLSALYAAGVLLTLNKCHFLRPKWNISATPLCLINSLSQRLTPKDAGT